LPPSCEAQHQRVYGLMAARNDGNPSLRIGAMAQVHAMAPWCGDLARIADRSAAIAMVVALAERVAARNAVLASRNAHRIAGSAIIAQAAIAPRTIVPCGIPRARRDCSSGHSERCSQQNHRSAPASHREPPGHRANCSELSVGRNDSAATPTL